MSFINSYSNNKNCYIKLLELLYYGIMNNVVYSMKLTLIK